MKPQYEPKTLEQKLGYLVEECGEVLAAAGKTLRWGLDSSNPELPPEQRETNRAWLERELVDLEGAIARVQAALAPPAPVNSCNRHDDCAAADQIWRQRGRHRGADHCRDETCEDCFGS